MTLDEHLKAQANAYLRSVLDETGENISHAARIAGRNRTEFYRLLCKYEVRLGRQSRWPGSRPKGRRSMRARTARTANKKRHRAILGRDKLVEVIADHIRRKGGTPLTWYAPFRSEATKG